MPDIFSPEELREIGFERVGKKVLVSKDARFFAIQGELGDEVRIDAFSILTGRIFLGAKVHISPFCFLSGAGGAIRMASHSGLSAHVSLFTKSADYSKRKLAGIPKLTGDVAIGENSIIGAASTIMPGTKIGKNVSIGCNSVVSGPIKSGSIIVSRGTGLVTLSTRTARTP